MTKPRITMDGLTSANLRAGLNRAVPASELQQKGLTSANLQAGLAAPPAPPPAPTPAPASGTSGKFTVTK